MFFKVAILASLTSYALATLFITSPTASTTFTGGKNATIKWQDSPDKPSLSEWGFVKVSIYTGNALQQTLLQEIASSVDASKINTIAFTPDPNIGPNGNSYFIRVESLSLKDSKSPQYPALAFSAMFELEGMSGNFSPAVQQQVDGAKDNPVGGSAGGSTGGSGSATGTKPTGASSTSSNSTNSPTKANAAASSTQSNAAAGRVSAMSGVSLSWVGVLGGIAAGALFL